MESKQVSQKKPMTPLTLVIYVISFGICIVAISLVLSTAMFPVSDYPGKTIEATNLIVTAILGSAVTMVALTEMQKKA